jgi:ribose transport system permease protein
MMRVEQSGSRPAPSLTAIVSNAPGAAFVIAAIAILMAFMRPDFFSSANLVNIALQVTVLAIIAFGMTLVILTEGIDLSAGPVLGLTGVIFATLVVTGYSIPLAMLAAFTVGLLFGVFNGVLVAVVGLPPFIVTLGSFGIAQSLAMVLTAGNSVVGLPVEVRWFNEGIFAGIPVPILLTGFLFLLVYLLLYRTKFGRYVFAIGGNARALRLAGVNVSAYLISVYALAGLLTACASLVMTARINAAHPTVGIGLEFDAIAAVVLGGTSFERGIGGLWGTLIGAIAVGVLRNSLNLLGVPAEWQVCAVGVVIILAVAIDTARGRLG